MSVHQGDLCPHCGFFVVMPPDIEPICICCNNNVLEASEE